MPFTSRREANVEFTLCVGKSVMASEAQRDTFSLCTRWRYGAFVQSIPSSFSFTLNIKFISVTLYVTYNIFWLIQ